MNFRRVFFRFGIATSIILWCLTFIIGVGWRRNVEPDLESITYLIGLISIAVSVITSLFRPKETPPPPIIISEPVYPSSNQPLPVQIVGSFPISPPAIEPPPPPIIKPMPEISGRFPYGGENDIRLIGRDAEVADIENALKTKSGIFITGAGGIGKTRLTIEIATRAVAAFADKITWLRLEDYVKLDTLIELVRDHVWPQKTVTSDNVQAKLAEKAVLIILDNAEECADTAAFTAWLFGINPAGGTRWLINGRSVWREMHNKVTEIGIDPPQQPEAILQAMAQRSGVLEKIAGQEKELVTLARQHPRLLWYAVGWLQDFPVSEVLMMLRELPRSADIDEALKDIVQRTLNRIQQVDGEQHIAALRKLAVCRGGFTLEAAKALIGDPQPLRVLQRWHLLTLTQDRYELDPLATRATGEDDTAYNAHLEYYQALANEHEKKQDFVGLDIESANLDIAFARACAKGEWEKAYWFYTACREFLANRGRFEQRKHWLEQVAQALGVIPSDNMAGIHHASPLPSSPITDYLRASIHNDLGIIYQETPTGNRRNNLQKAIAAYQQALIYRTPDTAPLDFAMTQNNLGAAYDDLAQLEDCATNLQKAIAAYQQALIYRTPDTAPLAYAQTQNNLGNAFANLAQLEDSQTNLQKAIAAYQQALVYRTSESVPLDYARTQNNLGTAYADLSQMEDRKNNLQNAIAAYQKALIYWTPDTAPLNYAMTKANLGVAYRDLGEKDQAIACWHEAEKYFRQMGYVRDADNMLRAIAAVE